MFHSFGCAEIGRMLTTFSYLGKHSPGKHYIILAGAGTRQENDPKRDRPNGDDDDGAGGLLVVFLSVYIKRQRWKERMSHAGDSGEVSPVLPRRPPEASDWLLDH